jgi:flagellar biosynthesis protein FlhF
MSAQRFVAANATEALRRIKAELGGDAVVLSSNDVEGGVEIVAIAAAELGALSPPKATAGGLRSAAAAEPSQPPSQPPSHTPPHAPPHAPPHTPPRAPLYTTPQAPLAERIRRAIDPTPRREAPGSTPTPALRQSFEARVSPQATPRQPVRESLQARTGLPTLADHRPPGYPRFAPLAAVAATPPPATLPPSALLPAAAALPGMNALSSQMAEMKNLLSGHLAASFWSSLQQSSPGHAQLTRRLLNAGLSSQMVSQMLAELPAEPDFERLLDRAQQWVKQRLQVQDAFSLFDKGGVYAFIGPTGVGKTTTLAKIAARCVLRYGRRQVALMTTDTYRIGAQEQLRVFARILSLPVVALRDSDDLESKVADLSSRKIVLLDTAGVSQRDTMMVEQLEMIQQGCGAVHRVLVMSATTSTRTLDDVVASHHNAIGGQGIDSAILTKIDEGMSLAPAIDCVLRHRLPLLFLSNGQRVPEDLFAADAAYIAHRTVNPRGGDESGADPAHVPAMIADDIHAWAAEARTA